MKKTNKWIYIFLLLLILLGIVLPVTTIASELELIKEAILHLEQQNYKKAIETIDGAMLSLWSKAPLELKNLTFTEGEASGYGLYQKRNDNHFLSGETFFFYAEPRHYNIKERTDGLYEIHFKEDLYILDMEGNILWGQLDFLEKHIISHAPNKELFVVNTITQDTPFPEGEYQFKIVFKDVDSQKTVEETISFVVD